MAVYSRQLLSGSLNGKPIQVVSQTGPGDLVHTAVVSTSSFDEIYLWASNVTNLTARLTVAWGDNADPAGFIVKTVSIPAFSPPIPIATGQVLNNSLVVRAFCDTSDAINLTGYVNRIA